MDFLLDAYSILERRVPKQVRQSAGRIVNRVGGWVQTDVGQRWAESYTLNSVFVDLLKCEDARHPYTWGAMQGARLARALQQERASFIEFGVAGGNGLIALERIASRLESRFEVRIDVFGFDTGTGLPKSQDPRDMPNLWDTGAFSMDVEKLTAKLDRAQLILGNVESSVSEFLSSSPQPVAFVAFDLDYYTSTRHALEIFSSDTDVLLPRIHCYFDDILGYTFGDHVGERLAIEEFNQTNTSRKLSPIHGLRYYMPKKIGGDPWWGMVFEKYYMVHVFDHPLYGAYDELITKQAAARGHALAAE